MNYKKLVAVTVLPILLAALTPMLFAQDKHVEVGAFFNLDRLNNNSTNFYGLGGRLSILPTPHVALEAELAHDFEQGVTNQSGSSLNASFNRSNLRVTDGLFGVKVHNTGPVRIFGTLKTGFVNFAVSNQTVASGFTSALSGISNGDTRFALYPGAGIELGGGWIGLRLEAGDLMYFANGAHNNLRIAVGPQFRF